MLSLGGGIPHVVKGIYLTRDIVSLLAKPHKSFSGLKEKEIADALRLSRQAVNAHLRNIRSGGGRNGAKGRDVQPRVSGKVRREP